MKSERPAIYDRGRRRRRRRLIIARWRWLRGCCRPADRTDRAADQPARQRAAATTGQSADRRTRAGAQQTAAGRPLAGIVWVRAGGHRKRHPDRQRDGNNKTSHRGISSFVQRLLRYGSAFMAIASRHGEGSRAAQMPVRLILTAPDHEIARRVGRSGCMSKRPRWFRNTVQNRCAVLLVTFWCRQFHRSRRSSSSIDRPRCIASAISSES